MSQSPAPAPISVPQAPASASSGSSSNIERIFDAALKSYKNKTKNDLKKHDIFKQLETCDSPAAILAVFQAAQFDPSRTAGDDRLKKWLVPTINVLYAFSGTLSEGVVLVFPPAKLVFAGIGVLLLAAKDVAASQDILVDIFGRIESFFVRLEIYTEVPLTPVMTEKMVQITVEILDILATATKEMEQSRAKTFLKKVAGWTDLEDGLKKLDKLTNEEVVMASVQVLKVTHKIDDKVTAVGEDVRSVDEKVQVVEGEVQIVKGEVQVVKGEVQVVKGEVQVVKGEVQGVKGEVQGVKSEVQLVNDNVKSVDDKVQAITENSMEVKLIVQQTANEVTNVKRNQLRESLRKWQAPPDPSANHNIAGDRQHEGTAEWFFEANQFENWRLTGSLLWIHGKPGSGKSVLCSAIINDLTILCDAGSALMAYFYFDFRDLDKQARRNLLPSLLVQLSTRSDPFCDILSRLYETHDNGARQPSDKALTQCLKEMLTLPNQGPVYLIFDALDECPDTSDVPSPREQVLDLVKDLVGLQLPSLRICVTSRPEVDICDALESLASQAVSLQDERGQKKDIADYVRSVVYSGSGKFMRRWRKDDKEHVIETLSERADGMFRWVFCQLEMLRNCLPQNVQRVLRELPNSLDETYERMLREIGKVNPDQAYRLLQCLTVATRPLRVDELAEVLALDFDGTKKAIPALNKDWRWDDEQQGVLSTCSSLIVVVEDESSKTRVVQFAHFSVKEFLTSDRLANLATDVSRFHVRLEPAHTVIVQACLAILLQSDFSSSVGRSSPLSDYAAEHWVYHAQFENVSLVVEDGMRHLFDHAKPYFAAWLKSFDIDSIWYSFVPPPIGAYHVHPPESISPSEATAPLCLYYAALCGFRDLTKYLVAEYPQHVNARVGRNKSPLAAALSNKHIQVAELLHQHGADLHIGYRSRTLLHAASLDGSMDVAEWLLNIGADANVQQYDHTTPLHLAAAGGHLEVVRMLLGHGADVNAATMMDSYTPLHEASKGGHVDIVRLLIQNGADASTDLQRLFFLASSSGSAETVELFIRRGGDVNARDVSHSTPLHLASSSFLSKGDHVVRTLIQNGADVDARDGSHSTPLHLASRSSNGDIVKTLILNGVDVNARDGSHSTPLHFASQSYHSEGDGVVQTLIQNGADVNARDRVHKTPLHHASSSSSSPSSDDIVKALIQNGVDVNARDENHWTPLHFASLLQHSEGLGGGVVQTLIQNGADVNARDQGQSTPLHQIFYRRYKFSLQLDVDSLRLLLENGADVDAVDDEGWTPFQLASSGGYHEMAQLLLDHRASVEQSRM
ncbi:ankyrin repeat-containing domain protein [Lactarius deliciosus]|nr:ankyrin repeat-containing domain protein [Lactarius deliciosus]